MKRLLYVLSILGVFLCQGFLYAHAEDQGTLYFTEAFESPGSIYKLSNEDVSTHYTRPSDKIYYLATAPDGTLYFSNANDYDLYKLYNGSETKVYTHDTYLRDVQFDSDGKLYFSESSGSSDDGYIYMLDNSQATLFYQVQLSQVDGYWFGTFAFDNSNNLWLSTGNSTPAHIYKVVGGVPQCKFTSNETITGFTFDSDGNIIYANWDDKIYRLTVPGYVQSEIYTSPSADHLSDVTLSSVQGTWPKVYDRLFSDMNSSSALPMLREYRDEIINGDQNGKQLVDELYKNYSSQVAKILLTHPGLMASAAKLAEKHLQGIKDILNGQKMQITPVQLLEVKRFLNDLARSGDTGLKRYIRSVQRMLNQKDLKPFGIEVSGRISAAPSKPIKGNLATTWGTIKGSIHD
jgi:hypothetical protein